MYLFFVDLLDGLNGSMYPVLLAGHRDLILVNGGWRDVDPRSSLSLQLLHVRVLWSADEGVVDLNPKHNMSDNSLIPAEYD